MEPRDRDRDGRGRRVSIPNRDDRSWERIGAAAKTFRHVIIAKFQSLIGIIQLGNRRDFETVCLFSFPGSIPILDLSVSSRDRERDPEKLRLYRFERCLEPFLWQIRVKR